MTTAYQETLDVKPGHEGDLKTELVAIDTMDTLSTEAGFTPQTPSTSCSHQRVKLRGKQRASKRNPYMCPVTGCDKSYGRINALELHMRIKHEDESQTTSGPTATKTCSGLKSGDNSALSGSQDKPVVCHVKFCCRRFRHKDEMLRHAKVHLETRPIACIIPDCTLTFTYPKSLDSHLARSHPGTHSFPCPYQSCSKVFQKLHLLKFHEGVHSEQRSFSCPHDGCLATFRTYYHRSSHIYKCHRAVDKVPCNICGKLFQYGYQLTRHMQTHCPATKQGSSFLCPVCGKGFSSSEKLRRHASVHSEDRPYLCTECGASFKRRDALNKHERTHQVEVQVAAQSEAVCTICGKVTKSRVGLDNHMRVHDLAISPGKYMYRCEEPGCGKTFKDAKYLSEHRVLHYPECHSCSNCGKTFKCARYLRTHMKTHSSERNHHCKLCGKAFKTARDLSGHMETHEVLRKHMCPRPDCGRAYKTSSCLRIHMKRHWISDQQQRQIRNYKSVQSPAANFGF